MNPRGMCFRFRIISLLWLFSFCNVALGDSVNTNAYEREDLYTAGVKAFRSEDYSTALKYLFAFRLLNKQRLMAANSDSVIQFRTKLDNAIEVCEYYTRKPSIFDYISNFFSHSNNQPPLPPARDLP
jgi:hypothetical protein